MPIFLRPTLAREADAATTARRLTSLKGVRVALLDNSKHNADRLMDALARRLRDQGASAADIYRKPLTSARPFDEEPFARIATYQAAVGGTGD